MRILRRIEIIFTLAILLGATSCLGIICINGNGVLASEERTETGFYAIDNATSANVQFSKSDNYTVVVEADENLMSYIKTSVSSGVLEISIGGTQCIRPDRTPVIYISGPELAEVYLSGSGDIFADTLSGNEIKIYGSGSGNIISNYAQASEIEIKNSGSGNISIYNIISSDASFKISGSGDISAEGNTEALNLSSTGSGNLNAENLVSDLFNTLISGSGNAYVNIIDEMIVTLTGSGNLYYTGNPDIHKNITGSGRIININK